MVHDLRVRWCICGFVYSLLHKNSNDDFCVLMIDKWSEIVSIKYIPMLFKSSRKDEFGFNSDFTTVPKIIKKIFASKPILSRLEQKNNIFLVYGPDKWAQKPDIYRCISSRLDKLGFNADLQNSFGKVYITEKREIFNAKNSVEWKIVVQVAVWLLSGPNYRWWVITPRQSGRQTTHLAPHLTHHSNNNLGRPQGTPTGVGK